MRASAVLAVGLAAVSLVACTPVLQYLRDNHAPPGVMNDDGTINPCHGAEEDHQACGNAIFNARGMKQIDVGQSRGEVRTTMRRDPDEREMVTERGTVTERWTYLTDYRWQRTTVVVFTNGYVSALEQGTPQR
jgi:hypothetical protein